ncbi:hypothetical protein BMS3Abin15_00650 [bacterium BMS3Abin15]|nr:hypothetical protein BMS3Abin15_00650 [bacterium BMS3Abin15]GBE27429.1 hypothetical protein BMS3Bbin03_01354 [bacterium BMS3Bbin03]
MRTSSRKLPSSLKKYFWDCDFDSLTLEKYGKFIVERILSYGNLHDIKWLFAHMEENQIRDTVLASRRLDKKTLNYWKTFFEKG